MMTSREFDAPRSSGPRSRAIGASSVILKKDMRHRLFWLGSAPLVLWGLLLGCESGSGTPVSTITDTGSLATQLAQAFCARQACCGLPSDAAVPADAGSADAGSSCSGAAAPDASAGNGGSSCEARALVAITEQLALVATAAAEGLLVLDSTVANTCIAAYQGGPCDGSERAIPNVQIDLGSCDGLFIGYIPVGERCDMTPECVAHSFCLAQGTGQNVTSLGGSASLGVCFPFEQTGQACNSSNDCDPSAGLSCDTGTLTCEVPAS
jgi:hypothetical protein